MGTITMHPTAGTGRVLAARPAKPAGVRLTRRGRLVVFVLALAVVLTVGVLLAAGSVATERPERTEVVMVGTGDTLWGIAADLTEDGDVRAMMQRIETLNDLESSVVGAGQRLRVPVD